MLPYDTLMILVMWAHVPLCRRSVKAEVIKLLLLTHDLDNEAEHQRRYSATCSPAFRFSDEMLLTPKII